MFLQTENSYGVKNHESFSIVYLRKEIVLNFIDRLLAMNNQVPIDVFDDLNTSTSMKLLAFVLFSFLVVDQNVSYAQHIPLGITVAELPQYITKIGGGILKYPPPGIPDYPDTILRSVDSVKLLGYYCRLNFTVNEGKNKIMGITLAYKNVSKADFNKITRSLRKEFGLKAGKISKVDPPKMLSWDYLKSNRYITGADIIYYPWENLIMLSYWNKKYY